MLSWEAQAPCEGAQHKVKVLQCAGRLCAGSVCLIMSVIILQEEYLLHQANTMRLIGGLSKEGGIRAVADSVYPYLSLAAEAFLGQLLNSMVKIRLQREDMGRSGGRGVGGRGVG